MTQPTMAFTEDELGFMQTVQTSILTAAADGRLDLNQLARRELAMRGLDHDGQWVGFHKARTIYERSKN